MAEKRGRIPVLTPDLSEQICKLVAAGNPVKFAAESVGITERTAASWQAKGRSGVDPIYVQFLQDIKKARSQAVTVSVRQIRRAAKRSWQASAWWCERMHPEHFGTDKKLVAQLLDQVSTLKAQLDNIHADAGRNRTRRKAARKKGKPRHLKGDGEGI